MSFIERLDIQLFFLVNHGMRNGFFDILMPFLTEPRNWMPVIIPAVIWMLVKGGRKGRVTVVVLAVALGLSDYTTGKILKELIGRLRPCNVLEGINLLVYCGQYGFPSTHASNMAALAVIGGYYYRKAVVPLVILALVIGYSRVYVGVHYPFDVLGGYVWGGMVAFLCVVVARKITEKREIKILTSVFREVFNRSGDKKIVICAGEASGDMHGANLVKELLKLDPNIKFSGMGGDMMKDAGVHILDHVRDMAIVGIVEVISKFSLIKRAMRDMEFLMDTVRPDVVILIDYPGFNLRLAKKAKEREIKVVYYVSPQVWAWHKSRIKTIAQVVDKMMVVFPFEVPLYEKVGVDVEFVGHPLMDMVPWDREKGRVKAELGFKEDDIVVGLLPGSRKKEVESLLPDMLKAAGLISKRINNVRFVLPVAGTLDVDYIKAYTSGADIDLRIFKGKAYDVMAASDMILIASGTATLEAAIIGTPMVITYRVAPLTYMIGKMLVDMEHIGLPNIVLGKGVVPELIQYDASGERMAAEGLKMLEDQRRLTETGDELKKVRDILGGPGASRRAAEIVYRVIKDVQ